MAVIRLARSNINNIPQDVSFGIPAISHLTNEPLKLYVGGSNNTPVLLNTTIFRQRYLRTYATPVVVAGRTERNIVTDLINGGADLESTNANLKNATTGFSFNATNNSIIFPPFLFETSYIIRVVLTGTIGGNITQDRQFQIDFRRGLDSSLLGSPYCVKLNNNDLSGMSQTFPSYTENQNDPYCQANNGLQIIINNTDNVDITLNAVQILIQGTVTNYQQ